MDINSLFPSNYLKAADFPVPRVLTIRGIGVEEVGDDNQKKPILYFVEESRGLVLNKTNAGLIAHAYTVETDGWVGRQVELHKEPVPFQGRIVGAIRCRVPQLPAATPIPAQIAAPLPVQTVPQTAADSSLNDDIDF